MILNFRTDWWRFLALLLILIMGVLHIVFPRNMLKWNLAFWGGKKLNGRQDRKAVWIVRVIGIVMVLFSVCIAGTAFYVWILYR